MFARITRLSTTCTINRSAFHRLASALLATAFLLSEPLLAVTDLDASFSQGTITLPVIQVGAKQYLAELRLHDSNNSQYRLIKAQLIKDPGAIPVAVYSGGQLNIEALMLGETPYQVAFTRVNASPLILEIQSASSAGSNLDPFGMALLNYGKTGFSALPDGRGGINYEPVLIDSTQGFDKSRSLAAFQETLYPWLRSSTCISCHNTTNTLGSGAQAPLHSDSDISLAHEYALTRVDFSKPENSKFYVRMAIDRHNCPYNDCETAGREILEAIQAWQEKIDDMLVATPRTISADTHISETEVESWIAQDKTGLPAADKDYIIYTSLHELHNEGLSAEELNIVRAGLSKALNSVARWAPGISNPEDVNGLGILYKFDIRNYWGWNKAVKGLLFGGSDDDLAFGPPKLNYQGVVVNSTVQQERYNYSDKVSWDPEFAKVVWERVLHGNVEGANVNGATIPPYIDGFKGTRSSNAAGEYVARQNVEWVETAQLIYTLTRPDVYNSIMMIPMYADQLEDELGVIRDEGMDSYDYVISYDAITVDSRLLWRAKRAGGGWYWKTWDIFTGQLGNGDFFGNRNIFDVYAEGGTDIRFPWWANPIPVFVNPQFNAPDNSTWSFISSLAQPFALNVNSIPAGCDPQPSFSGIDGFYNCRHFNGMGGGQQSASEIIWDLPNGLQGYMLTGAFNQRRVDAFVNIVRDPRIIQDAQDEIAHQTGFTLRKKNGGLGGFNDPRLNVGSSCIGCHIDGLNRINNDMRDWLDENPARLPSGPYGVDGWIDDPETLARVRELYPPSSTVREYVEQGRNTFLGAMDKIKQAMMLGDDKNLFIEPVIWTVEYVQQQKYKYPQTTSN